MLVTDVNLEFAASSIYDESSIIWKHDNNGNLLAVGNPVAVIGDLPVKGSPVTLKRKKRSKASD